MGKLIHSFDPIVDGGCRILVLGTMPGEESLRKQQYYGHPRNAFWPIMAALCGQELPDAYQHRKAMLLETRIALWDVCRRCERDGSLDSNISNEEPNRIGELLRHYPQIRTIASAKITTHSFRHSISTNSSAPCIRLSTSRSAHPNATPFFR